MFAELMNYVRFIICSDYCKSLKLPSFLSSYKRFCHKVYKKQYQTFIDHIQGKLKPEHCWSFIK